MSKDTKTLSILAHILGIVAGFIGPLIILLVSKDKEVKKHAKTALNWQFSYLIYAIISFILIFVLIGFVLIFAFAIANLIFCIIAAVRASEGKIWKYPLSIRFLKI